MTGEQIMKAIAVLLDDQPIERVIPVLIVISARALTDEAEGDIDKLSMSLFKFYRLMASLATDMAKETLSEAMKDALSKEYIN